MSEFKVFLVSVPAFALNIENYSRFFISSHDNMDVFIHFLSKIFFYDKMDLRLFYFRVTIFTVT